MIAAEDIARQVPNAGSGSALVEEGRVVLRDTDGRMVWAEIEDGVWKVFGGGNDEEDLNPTVPLQTAPEVARALVRRFLPEGI